MVKDPRELARLYQAAVLKRLGTTSQAAIAVATGISEPTISRVKNEHLETLCLLLAHAGLKIVSAERICVDREMYEAMTKIATRAMADSEMAQRLVWEDEH